MFYPVNLGLKKKKKSFLCSCLHIWPVNTREAEGRYLENEKRCSKTVPKLPPANMGALES